MTKTVFKHWLSRPLLFGYFVIAVYVLGVCYAFGPLFL